MKNVCIICVLLSLQQVKTDIRYDNCVYWAYSKGYGLPEYTENIMVNDVTVYHHDSSLKSKMPCPDWITSTEGKKQWSTIHDLSEHNVYVSTLGFQTATEEFNLTGSLTDKNIYQGSCCCSLYPDGTYSVMVSHAFNGKDFVSFDINTRTFVAAVPQAFLYKTRREKDFDSMSMAIAFGQTICLKRVKELKHAPDVLVRKVPEVQILKLKQQQKKAGSVTVMCHVTGFYPREVQVIWFGPDLQSVDEGDTEVLPNGDGTYQTRKSVIVPEEDVGKQNYSCVVLHISVSNNITTVWVGERASGGVVVWIAILGCILLSAAAVGFGVWWWRCRTRDAVI